jgi:hypothetical protein
MRLPRLVGASADRAEVPESTPSQINSRGGVGEIYATPPGHTR